MRFYLDGEDLLVIIYCILMSLLNQNCHRSHTVGLLLGLGDVLRHVTDLSGRHHLGYVSGHLLP